MTSIQVKSGKPTHEALDVLAVLLFEGDALDASIDRATGGAAARAVELGDFKGKLRQTALLYGDLGRAKRVLLVGCGPRKGQSLERVRRAAGTAASEARRLEARALGLVPPPAQGDLAPAGVAAAAAEGAALADYAFDRLKTEDPRAKGEAQADGSPAARAPKKARPPLAVTVFAERGAQEAVATAALVAEATNHARDLGNEPGNRMTPRALAAAAQALGRASGFKVKVHDEQALRRLGMGGLLGVARGSAEPPRLIEMEWAPPGHARGPALVLVGKGLTFDSGGISIKPADKMWEMKFDKCGGCAVIGAMAAIARARLPLRVVGLVPSTENMPGGRAVKPGDVLTAYGGRTIEVLNTDAEGRLILADALGYAARFEPAAIVDLATLTGAVIVALGDGRAAVMATDDPLRAAVERAGEATGELVWPLPLDEGYGEHVKGEVADVKNLGRGREAGTIAGGWFLRNFVPQGVPWAHLDIAGTAWASSDPGKGYLGKGATGWGVRLLFELARARAGEAGSSAKKKSAKKKGAKK